MGEVGLNPAQCRPSSADEARPAAAVEVVAELLEEAASPGSPSRRRDVSPGVLAAAFDVAQLSKLDGTIGPSLARLAEPIEFERIRQRLIERKHMTMIRNNAGLTAAAEFDRLMRHGGIEYALLKGPVQQHRLYGDFFARPSGDVDVIVRRRDFAEAQTILRKAGFNSIPAGHSRWWDHYLGERHFLRPGRVPEVIDLHHRLQQPGSPQPRSCESFVDRAETHSVRGQSLRVVAGRDIPLLSAMSLVKAFFNHEPCGSHAFDLLVALGPTGPSTSAQLVEDGEAQGLGGTVRLALRALGALFPAARVQDAPSGLADETLRLMVLAPGSLMTWPRRREILAQACANAPLRIVREWSWLVASELSRRSEETRPLAVFSLPRMRRTQS